MHVGHRVERKGDITALNFIGAGAPEHLERVLGFEPGRLANGYAVLGLRDHVAVDEFQLGGMTHFSGGRYGLPLADPAADAARPSVDAAVTRDYDEGGRKLREMAAAKINRLSGTERTVKIVPVIGHSEDLAPSQQYPQGSGAPQWKLVVRKGFTVLMTVDAAGIASGRDFVLPIGASARYDDRARIARYLASA